MKKFLVVGNPIEHSLSPRLHNYWIKNNGIDAIYEKTKLDENELENIVLQIKQKKNLRCEYYCTIQKGYYTFFR